VRLRSVAQDSPRVHPQSATDKTAGLACLNRAAALKVPITLAGELSDETITATARLNLASCEIDKVEHQDCDAEALGAPWNATTMRSAAARSRTTLEAATARHASGPRNGLVARNREAINWPC
jgi:hypothetical protein